MPNRFWDWFRQGEADLQLARHASDGAHFEWACFAAQQAAEKALKAVYLSHGQDAWGHTLTALVGQMPDPISAPRKVIHAAQVLDKHHIPTRYPYGFDSGAPADFYTEQEAQDAIEKAEQIIEFCRSQID